MGFIRWIIGMIIAVYVTGFAVLNRQGVDVFYSPAHPAYELPLYAIGVGGIIIGFMVGAFAVWFNMSEFRDEKRKQKKKIKQLEKNLETANDGGKAQNPPSDFFPAITHKKANS